MLKIAKTIFDSARNALDVTVFHLTVGSDVNPMYEEKFYEENFRPVLAEADRLNIPIQTEYGVTDDLEPDIVRFINENDYDFLLIGAGLSYAEEPFFKKITLFRNIRWLNRLTNELSKSRTIFYPGTLIKDKTHYFVERSNCSVGIFVNRNFTTIAQTVVLISGPEDLFLLQYAHRLLANKSEVTLDIYDANGLINTLTQFTHAFQNLRLLFPGRVTLVDNQLDSDNLYPRYSFMLISYPFWNETIKADEDELQKFPLP